MSGKPIWNLGGPRARLVPPRIEGELANTVENTVNGFLAGFYGWTLPVSGAADPSGLSILVGNESNNPAIRKLAAAGVNFRATDLGDEGFRIVTLESGERGVVIVTADTPVGLKHGCQELVLFRISATSGEAWVDWPIDVTRKPVFPYRGVYILPCWAAHDSIDSWRRVLRFHSELTINRNWFWLAGFPLIAEYGGQYQGVDLSDPVNVRDLIALCRGEGMKFYIGGGWYTWHHQQHAGDSIERGIRYYLDVLELLPGAEGIYLEPTGEGATVAPEVWNEHVGAMGRLAKNILRERPQFEFAVAIGRFNDPDYRRAVHRVDRKRLFWWWCWGDPVRDNALAEHSLVLRWHIISPMADYHGSTRPPQPEETVLHGLATSYDPGQGFGNPWNGWGKLGVEHPRNFHPHTMPFFSHQYRFRERCWDVHQSEEEFAIRLGRRLFDADMPHDAVRRYLSLAEFCPKPQEADIDLLDDIDQFVRRFAGTGTARNRDTLSRMREALDGIRKHRAPEKPGE